MISKIFFLISESFRGLYRTKVPALISSTLKNSLMYTSSGELRCYTCMLEEIIDRIGEASSEMSPEDMDRLKLKIDSLKKTFGN